MKAKGNATVQLAQYNDFILFFKMPVREIQKEKVSIIYLGQIKFVIVWEPQFDSLQPL